MDIPETGTPESRLNLARDAIARAGGFRLADGFISPFDLIEIGLLSAEEAKELHDLETAGTAR